MPKIEKPQKRVVEVTIQDRIMLDLGDDPDLVLWRNSVIGGTGSDGRQLHGGLPNGSADLVGVLQVSLWIEVRGVRTYNPPQGPNRPPAKIGRFFALEVKLHEGEVPPPLEALEAKLLTLGSRPPKGFLHQLDQRRWQALVQSRGGFCAFVWSVQGAISALDRAKAGELE